MTEMKSYDTFEYRALIDEGTDDQIYLTGYKYSRFREALFLTCTLGMGFLFLKWYPHWLVTLAGSLCPISSADFLLIKDTHGQKTIIFISQQNNVPSSYNHISATGGGLENSTYKYFEYKSYKYIWSNDSFKRLRGLDIGFTTLDLINKFPGLSKREQLEKKIIYGPNCIDVEVKSTFQLLVDEVLNPFYIFQVASITLWCLDNYYIYASCIFLISFLSICLSLAETKKQRRNLRDMVSQSNKVALSVCRGEGGEEFEDVPSCELVPGDIIHIPPGGCHMPCDAVLLAGTCIVNESMLTGESVPETKLALNTHHEEAYSPESHKRNTLFCGTHIIQTRYYGNQKVLALVVRTGYSTTKGSLIRSIMFPPPVGFKFYKDSMKFVCFLAMVAGIGMVFSIYLYVSRGSSLKDTIVRSLDLITIVVPPALPAAMTAGTVYAQRRLKHQRIYCISPQHINIGGKVKLICFDKTGTLTEEGLDLWAVVPSVCKKFQDPVLAATSLSNQDPLKISMAACHSLTLIDGTLCGDPLDLNMFQATNWQIEEPGPDSSRYEMITPTIVRPQKEKGKPDLIEDEFDMPYEVGIIRQFPFSSSLQRMAVICRTLGERNMALYVKGAPEKIASLCTPDTVPEDFHFLLQNYTMKGYRVIAMAWKPLPAKLSWHHAQKAKREELEEGLMFLGLLVMQNMMKPETKPIIKLLQEACIRSVMVTGDNLLTALSVAHDSEMIPPSDQVIILHIANNEQKLNFEYLENSGRVNNYHFAMEGKTFSYIRSHFPHFLVKLLTKTTVFARMSPNEKTHLVELLKDLGYVVTMCGDGANDCGALKSADVGISLSEAEASVAAPFTSKVPNISCVPLVVKEGRCSLVTTFAMFKFISMYSLIQFISVLILYYVKTNLTDFMFLYIDIGIITVIAFLMGTGGPYYSLVDKRPRGSLINVHTLLSLFCQLVWLAGVQGFALYLLKSQPWYVDQGTDDDSIFPNYANTIVFLVTIFQYLTKGIVFSKGAPFRKPVYRSYLFAFSLFLITCSNVFLFFNPFPWLSRFLQMQRWPLDKHLNFRIELFALVAVYAVGATVLEALVPESGWLKKISRMLKNGPKNRYKTLQRELDISFRNNALTLSMNSDELSSSSSL